MFDMETPLKQLLWVVRVGNKATRWVFEVQRFLQRVGNAPKARFWQEIFACLPARQKHNDGKINAKCHVDDW